MQTKVDNAGSFATTVVHAIQRSFTGKIEVIKAIARKAAQEEADLLFKVIADDFTGVAAMPAELAEFEKSGWAELTKSYRERKGNSLFFYKDQELRREISHLRPTDILGDVDLSWRSDTSGTGAYVEGFGVLKDTSGAPAPSYNIFVRPYHRYTLYYPMAADDDGDAVLDRWVGQTLTRGYVKLENLRYDRHIHGTVPNGATRYLLLPSLLYFMKYRIPAAVRRALLANGFTVKAD